MRLRGLRMRGIPVCAWIAILVSIGWVRGPALANEAGDVEAAGPDIFVILLDAASARYFGAYGASSGSTPEIDALARRSVVFERAYSQAPTTTPSVASLFTGVRVTTHGAVREGFAPELVTLAETLRAGGFATAAVSANPNAGLPRTQLDRGFERFVGAWKSRKDLAGRGALAGQQEAHRGPAARPVTDAAQQLQEGVRPGRQFTYVHYLQPHQPYDAAAAFQREFPLDPELGCGTQDTPWPRLRAQLEAANRSGSSARCLTSALEARYRANLRRVDSEVGRLLRWLVEQDRFVESLVVVTADHGEAFFEHGRFGHNVHLYDDMTRIPLILKFPDSDGIAPRRIASLVETIDVMPTLLDYLGIARIAQLEGRSLMPEIRGGASGPEGEELVMSSVTEVPLHAIRRGDYKYIHAQGQERGELYDLASDAGEQENLVHERPELAQRLRERLGALTGIDFDAAQGLSPPVQEPGEAPQADSAIPLDPEIRELLEKLGYAE